MLIYSMFDIVVVGSMLVILFAALAYMLWDTDRGLDKAYQVTRKRKKSKDDDDEYEYIYRKVKYVKKDGSNKHLDEHYVVREKVRKDRDKSKDTHLESWE